MKTHSFAFRHIGPRDHEAEEMLKTIGVDSLDELIAQTVPDNIRMKEPLNLAPALTEQEFLVHIQEQARKNQVFRTYIGLGYHNTILPGVIQRNILENPGWYTAYTPYQAEIAQGRLEALLNYQTMVSELTGMELANASLLDEATAAAEAMSMMFAARSREKVKANANKFFVSKDCLPQNIDLLKTRCEPMGIELVIGTHREFSFSEEFFGALLQYPDVVGTIHDYRAFVQRAHEAGALVAVAADIMSLVMLTPPGEWGADVVVGTTQRFGIPLGYGGPHAAFFATRDEYKRLIPGRIIGQTIDRDGNPALRMALQTREQHIKRDRATSNICTAQVLLAVMAGMYAVYHGPDGLKRIATTIHRSAVTLNDGLTKLGYEQLNETFFDTLEVELGDVDQINLQKIAEEHKINFRYMYSTRIGISLNEHTSVEHVNDILTVLAMAKEMEAPVYDDFIQADQLPADFVRTSSFLEHDVFNTYHSETEMMRYLKKLERKDLSLNHSMIPLGSCTMKLNAATEMLPLSWPSFGNIHPFVPVKQAEGYQYILNELERDLAEITGFDATSLQPNSGAQGEYAGLMVIRAYHQSRGEGHRDVAIIPSSAHGTNPASAVMAGMKVVVVKCDERGNIDVEDLKAKADKHADNLACLMITYPSTHGVFEASVTEVTGIIHERGGQVYMDGANMNAQVGLTSPGLIGADVCHLNLHKTFAIPHGGGGPGMGPICVRKHLAPFLPGNELVRTGGSQGISSISAAPWGSSLVLLISYAYIKMLGSKGLTNSTKYAILNANYIKHRLEGHYAVLYTGETGRCAHEMILDCRPFKREAGVEVVDIAKRLMDYGYHAPTVSFPVAGTLMVEPTESEGKVELDRFCDALISIRKEVDEIVSEQVDPENNVLKNAPHTLQMTVGDEWTLPYSRQKASFPLDYIMENKFWPSVRRVDDAYGDRNLMCTCAPVEEYA
ncbi:MAG: glycine dehydrogenase (aminomethyl-transferring) [Bacteroidetes bacterium]|uniref:Glycine dehydrogenase (decarboxylating) n=1 Tax=Phaeocystidibacter marisrubri TaxID=1577780 RepID=A0A6L3ZDK5_9FLAO|nr:aminomethyl-transferring glycine dehydrogenase [Phaeocystidibacter marisrubri]KAB2815933.1 aminomethyl-transferring glycine dehydrogenase [Phaeocystidibacter marisrubri]TNE30777.1 MAG: glycine dehydrogenase (aminomethyl-transferring) [Bacteroidota bacterium]GGH66461.1 glycine dehydrogenase (aminomethyl-transferring) [Phaeocystidibacter marisrubri]